MRTIYYIVCLLLLTTPMVKGQTIIEGEGTETREVKQESDSGPIREWSNPSGYHGNPDKNLKLYKKKPVTRKHKKRKTKRSFGFKKK